uniref:Chondroitin proteoglycan 4 domain-containing protein n=1 Tax=Plectus sambesii TaxID=2011161 RepID=A0A914XDG1_9BILA
MREMQTVLDNAPLAKGRNLGQLNWKELFDVTQNTDATASAFESICIAYKNVDECLDLCPKTSPHTAHIRQTYGSLKYICVDHRNEFFANLPCLTKHEPIAMSQCRNEINLTMIASNRFSDAVVNKQHHVMKTRFSNLCTDLSQMIRCIEPITRRSCGDNAARMMLRFITLGFASFEQLYAQLGMTDHLPSTCRALINIGTGNGRYHQLPVGGDDHSNHLDGDAKDRLLADHDKDYQVIANDSTTKAILSSFPLLLSLSFATIILSKHSLQ